MSDATSSMRHVISCRLEEPGAVPRRSYPVTHGCPFAQGALPDPDRVRLRQADGPELPLATTVLSRWPDDSVRWLLLDAQVDLRPKQILELAIEYGEAVERQALETPLTVREDDTGLRVETEALSLDLRRRGTVLIAQANDVLEAEAESEPQMTLRDASGTGYVGRIESLEVEEQNRLRVVVKATGGYVSADGCRPLSWIVRIHLFANQPYARLYHTFVHDADEPLLFDMQELTLSLSTSFAGRTRAMLGAPAGTTSKGLAVDELAVTEADRDEPDRNLGLWEVGPGSHTVLNGPEGRLDRRLKSHGWIYLGDETLGLQIKLRHPAENYPKAYTTDGRRVVVHLYPDPAAWSPATEQPLGKGQVATHRDLDYAGALQIPQGMAKTHELFLYCGAALADVTPAAVWAAGWQQPLLLEIDPGAYADSGVFGDFPPYYDDYWPLEDSLRARVLTLAGPATQPLLGMVSFGDVGVVEPAEGGTHTGSTDNLHYDGTRAVFLQYVRRGQQPLFWRAEAMAWHLMEVDTVHHSSADPGRTGGPRPHWSRFHHYKTTNRDSLAQPGTDHTWFGGILDYYHLSGNRRALEVAELTGRYCAGTRVRHNWDAITPERRDSWADSGSGWGYSPRKAGWALTGMGDHYEARPDPALAAEMLAMVRVFANWQDADGRFRMYSGTFQTGACPFMTAAILTGLMRVCELLGDEEAGELCVKGCRFLATEAVTKEGLMWYKEAPINQTGPNSTNILNLRPMAFAFRRSGDRAILRCIWRQFRWWMDCDRVPFQEIKDALWALPTLEREGLLERWRDEV